MTREQKIEALALDMEAAWSGLPRQDWASPAWLRAATLAQDRIDAVSAGQQVAFETEQFLGGQRVAPGVYRLVLVSKEIPDAGF